MDIIKYFSNKNFYSTVKNKDNKQLIGFERNLLERPLTKQEGLLLLHSDIKNIFTELESIIDIYSLDITQQIILIDLIYTLGIFRFKKLNKVIDLVINKKYNSLIRYLLDSNICTNSKCINIIKFIRDIND